MTLSSEQAKLSSCFCCGISLLDCWCDTLNGRDDIPYSMRASFEALYNSHRSARRSDKVNKINNNTSKVAVK